MSNHRPLLRRAAALCVIVSASYPFARGQDNPAKKSPATREQKSGVVSPRISLSPRFVPGETFRYVMEYETTTDTSRTGFASDPQGPSNLVVNWNATVRMEILSADAATPGGIRLRTTYEKSDATVRSDSFDPAADETTEQYRKLEGKVVEFTMDANGKVVSVSGIEGIVDSPKAAQSAHQWVSQLSASAGAPATGVSIGETWSSEESADSLPIAGLVWRTDSQYLRNESCHPPNLDLASGAGGADPSVNSPENSSTGASENSQAPKDCAVILASLNLVHGKGTRDPTPPDLRKNGVQSTGKWTGSAQSLLYVSLDSGFVVSVTQTGAEQMDVTLTSIRGTSMRYAGTISTRSQVALASEDANGK